ncbi:MAG TPA: hypothetical protein VGL34_25515 [Steroidobacteraceae bacterium]
MTSADFVTRFREASCKLARSVVSIALAVPLAACGSMHGSSTDASSSGTTAAGAVTGTVDRSGATNTTNTADGSSMSTVGTPVTIAMAGSTPTVPASTGGAGSGATTTPPANKKSISGWVSCTGGTADDTTGAIKAFAAARHGAFTLVVDCPVHLHSGLAIDRGIFIDSGTSVEFTGSGKFFVDNMFHPAFVIANSSNITLTGWNVEWDGNVPITGNFGGYQFEGKFVAAASGHTQPAGAFNDLVLTPWLAANRSITFLETQGWVKSIWVGGINPAAVFFVTGDSSNVVFTGLKLYVPPSAGADHFMPMAFSLSANWKSNQTVTGKTPETTQYAAVPHSLTFSGVDFDGTLMGWQGNLQDTMFENITSHRYADLQDANGGTVGGIGKWFPPPHLFYLNTQAADPGLFNSNIHISNVLDEGPRLGVARDKGGADGMSGYALSLKLGCTMCSVDNYTSARPDGFMDVLPSDGLTVSNVNATFDSVFLNNVFPGGLRFPATGYSHVTFENVQLRDTAESTLHVPVGNAPSPTNDSIVFTNFQITMNRWAGADLPLPTIAGTNNSVALDFTMSGQSMKVSHLVKGAVTVTVKGTPTTVHSGASTVLSWNSKEASGCAASGSWAGSVGTSGTRVVKVSAAGNHDFNLNCQNASASSSTTLRVIAQ